MKSKIFIFLLALLSISKSWSQIIPEPTNYALLGGNFKVPAQVLIAGDEVFAKYFLKDKLENYTQRSIKLTISEPLAQIVLKINKQKYAKLPQGAYNLNVSKTKIIIEALDNEGLMNGVTTLLQLFPTKPQRDIAIKTQQINDSPRFAWRGLMLDVSRHFFTVADVKSYIDQMALYKFNILHWHLSDDEGWRVEIKSLPKLTEKGAWNVKREGYFGNFEPAKENEKADYGGFYTQEQIKEVVAYAKQRGVEIVPEIDVPGHSLAAIAAYPELGLVPEAKNYKVRSGEKIMDWDKHPVESIVNNSLHPASETTYLYMDKIFTEIAQLFPFDYIHIGGDECAKNFWENNTDVKALMQKENLKNQEEVQSYFTKRLVKMINAKGKKVIGWDEILEGGLAPGAAVMSWRGEKGGIEAAKQGHEVVMTPNNYAYLDYMQGDSAIESKVYQKLRLKKVYSFDPVPVGVDPKWIKGGQGNLWTEQVYNLRYAQYMTWPRALALSECLWCEPTKKSWTSFQQKLETHFGRLTDQMINYSPALYDPDIVVKNSNNQLEITLTPEADNLKIHYSWDNSPPDIFYPIVTKPITIPNGASQLKVITSKNGKILGRMMVWSIENLRARAAKTK